MATPTDSQRASSAHTAMTMVMTCSQPAAHTQRCTVMTMAMICSQPAAHTQRCTVMTMAMTAASQHCTIADNHACSHKHTQWWFFLWCWAPPPNQHAAHPTHTCGHRRRLEISIARVAAGNDLQPASSVHSAHMLPWATTCSRPITDCTTHAHGQGPTASQLRTQRTLSAIGNDLKRATVQMATRSNLQPASSTHCGCDGHGKQLTASQQHTLRL
jgi:hypothetical protein